MQEKKEFELIVCISIQYKTIVLLYMTFIKHLTEFYSTWEPQLNILFKNDFFFVSTFTHFNHFSIFQWKLNEKGNANWKEFPLSGVWIMLMSIYCYCPRPPSCSSETAPLSLEQFLVQSEKTIKIQFPNNSKYSSWTHN